MDKFSQRYDHRSGIPYGWNGQQYGGWGLWVLYGLILTMYGVPLMFFGSFIILSLKSPIIYLDRILNYLKWARKCDLWCKFKWIQYFKQENNSWFYLCNLFIVNLLVTIVGWVFILVWNVIVVGFLVAGFFMVVVGMPLVYFLTIFGSIFVGLWFPWKGDNWNSLKHGFITALDLLHRFDKETGHFTVFPCLNNIQDYLPPAYQRNSSTHVQGNQSTKKNQNSDQYWDLYTDQCIKTTSELLKVNYAELDDVLTADPNLTIAIPAIAVLDLLLSRDPENKFQLRWLNGEVCDGPMANDNIGNILWKKGLEVINSLDKTEFDADFFKKSMCADGNYEKELDEKDGEFKKIRTQLYDFSLAVTRVRPFQNRMSRIYSYEYHTAEGVVENASDLPRSPISEGVVRIMETSEMDYV